MNKETNLNEDEIDPEFFEEIKRRVEEIKSGKVKGVDVFEALKKM